MTTLICAMILNMRLSGVSDVDVIAATIVAEAGGEGKVGMKAVACVIQKRMKERKRSGRKVCLQRKQFSCWNGGSRNALRMLQDCPYAVKARAVAFAEIIAGGGRLIDNTMGSNSYCTLECHPRWTWGKEPRIILGRHKFYRI